MTANVANTLQSVLVFDGKKDQIVLTQPLEGLTNAVSIEFWANGASPLNATTTIVYGGDTKKYRIVNIHLPWGNNIYWDAGDGKKFDRLNKGIKSAEYKNTWNHWAFTKNTKTGAMSIYRNGSVWHTAQGKNLSLTDIQTFTIGSNGSGNHHWAGSLAEFRIWNIALEQNQVQANLHRRLTGDEKGLLVYLPLNDGQGVIAKDKSKSGKKNNGNIAGASWQEMAIPIELEASKPESNQVKEGTKMAEAKKTKKAKETTEVNAKYIPATGLEDYGRWKAAVKDYKRDPKEKPFRRGRIWS